MFKVDNNNRRLADKAERLSSALGCLHCLAYISEYLGSAAQDPGYQYRGSTSHTYIKPKALPWSRVKHHISECTAFARTNF